MTARSNSRPRPYTPDRRRAAPALEVRDRRSTPFVRVDKTTLATLATVPAGRPALIAVYVALVAHADNRSRDAHPSIDAIAQLAGCSRRTVQYKLAELHQLRLIDIDETYIGGRQTRSTYTLIDPPLTPPKTPPARGRIILSPEAIRDATVAPLNSIRGATVAPPRVQPLHPLLDIEVLEMSHEEIVVSPRGRARETDGRTDGRTDGEPPAAQHAAGRTDGRTDGEPPAAQHAAAQPLHPGILDLVIRNFAQRVPGSEARLQLAPMLHSCRFELAGSQLHITTRDARTARLARKHAGSLRLAAAETLSRRSIQLEITYEAPDA